MSTQRSLDIVKVWIYYKGLMDTRLVERSPLYESAGARLAGTRSLARRGSLDSQTWRHSLQNEPAPRLACQTVIYGNERHPYASLLYA